MGGAGEGAAAPATRAEKHAIVSAHARCLVGGPSYDSACWGNFIKYLVITKWRPRCRLWPSRTLVHLIF